MAFPGLPETSKVQIFASIVHYLRTNNVNVYVSKIFPSGLIFVGGRGYDRGAYSQNVNLVSYLGGVLTGICGM